MTTSYDPNVFDQAIYNKLVGSTALTALTTGGTAAPSIYQHMAPGTAAGTYVIYNRQASTPMHTMPTVAIENELFQVKAVVLSDSARAAGTVAAKIEQALTNDVLTITGYTPILCRRESGIDYPELGPGGQRFFHRGAIYRVQAQPS